MPPVIHGTMKHIFLPAIILSAAFGGVLFAQETEEGALPESSNAVADADNAGTALLDQATEAKLRANTVLDLSQVIVLCQRAKRAGLSGDNLRFCNQLLASSQLERGLSHAQQLLGPANVRPGDWQTLRQRALSDLEEAITVVKDQPIAYLRIAQLNHSLPDGDIDRARETLVLAVQSANDEPAIQVLAVRLLAEIEPEAEKRAAALSEAVKNGNPQIVMLHALTLLELNRHEEAANVLRKLIETESGDVELHERIIRVLREAGEYELAVSVLDALREKADNDQKYPIDVMKANMLNSMGRYEDALAVLNALLNTLSENVQNDVGTMILVLLTRSSTHLALDNFDLALKDTETADGLRPDFPPVLEQKYRIFFEQENYTDALTLAKKLQEKDENPHHFLLEIHALTELKRYDEAVKITRTLCEKYPDGEPQWLVCLEEIYSKQKAYDEAVEVIRTLCKKYPEGEPQWLAYLLDIYFKQKAYDKALALVEEQLQKSPDELRWILAKAGVFSEQKKWDEAADWLESQLQKTPDSRAIQLTLIGVFADRKNFRAAKERMQPLLEKEPDNLMLLRLDSQLSISQGLHAEAIQVLTKVVEADPSDYTSINNLAWVLATSPTDSLRNGNRAVELAERAGELTRHKMAFVLSTLAAAYAETGNFEKAREWAQRSVEVAKKERDKTEEERKELLENLQKEWEHFSQDMPFRELLNEEEE